MKIKLYYLIVFILASCTTPNKPEEEIKLPPTSNQQIIIEGNVKEYSRLGDIASDNSLVSVIHNDTIYNQTTNSEGFFRFDFNRISDSIKIVISKDDYVSIDTTISFEQVEKIDTINIRLNFTIKHIQTIIIFGNVNEYSQLGNTASQNSLVSLFHSDSTYLLMTNNEGYFTSSLTKKSDSLRIVINKNSFTSIDTTFILTQNEIKDTILFELNFTINCLKSYFPLTIGEKWNFKVLNRQISSNEFGEEELELIEVADDYSFVKYRITNHITKLIRYSDETKWDGADTTILDIYNVDTLKINITKNGSLLPDEYDSGPSYFDDVISLINKSNFCHAPFKLYFNVYHEYDSIDTLHFLESNGCGNRFEYKLVNGKGIVSLSLTRAHVIGFSGWDYILQN